MTAPAANAHATHSNLSWRSIPWMGGLFIVAISALAAYDIYRNYNAAAAETARELDTQARVLAEQTARSLQAIDLVLRHVAEQRRTGALAAQHRGDLHAYLKDQAVGLVQSEGLMLFDATGKLIASSQTATLPSPPYDASKDPLYPALKYGGSELVVDGLRRGVLNPDKWVVPIARRLQGPDGQFAGAIVAGGRVEYFEKFYHDVKPDKGNSIVLIHRNGSLIARHPVMPSAMGQRFPVVESLLAQRQANPEPMRGISPIDGVDRFGAIAFVPEHPLVVIVTRDADVAMASWRQQSVGTIARTLALGVLGALLLAMLRRQFLRLDKTRASLELSRERFALAAAGSDEGIWDWDVTGDRIYASARAREIFGLPPGADTQPREEWFGSVRLHPDDVTVRNKAMQAHMSGNTPVYEGEYRVWCHGDWRWVRVRGLCVRNAAGAPLRMAGSVTDIDARRRAEDARRVSEERYALAMAGLTGGHWVWETETDALFVSDSVHQLFGLAADTVVTTRTEYFRNVRVHPDDWAGLAKVNEDVVSGAAPRVDYEFRILLPGSNAIRWILTRAHSFRDAEGRTVRVAGVSIDISERKRTEEALRLSEERFALAVLGSDDGVWDFDYVNNRVFGSRRAREILGVPLEPEVQSLDEWFGSLQLHPDDAKLRESAMQAHLNGLTPAYEGEWRVWHPNGHYRWVRVRGMCVRDATGKPLRMAGSVSDIDARKRAEESLRQSEERYALSVAGSDDGVWDWDLTTGMAFESARARELQGLEPGPELQRLDDLLTSLRVHPEDAPRRAEGIRAHLAGETPAYECEYRVRRDDGHYQWIRVRALCIRDGNGKPYRMAGSVSDVHARKEAEEQSRRSQERFELAVAGSNDGIIDWDIVSDRVFASQRALRIIGAPSNQTFYTMAEWMKLLRTHPDDLPRHAAEAQRRVDGDTAMRENEYRVLHPNGEYRWVRVRGSAVAGPDGKAIRWAGSVSDIDEQKRTEEALRRSEERYQLAVQGSNEGLWDWDLASDSLFMSARAQELMWATAEEPLRPRREWIELTRYHPEDREMMRRELSAHLRGQTRHYKVEYRVLHHSGQWHWYRQRGVAVRDVHGRPTRMAGSMEDITDRKNAEGERERLETQLRQAQKLEAIGTLAGGIAHDFNNILAAILGYGEMAQKDAPEGSAQRRHIDAAISAGMRAKSLVERILAFSRSGMGERVPVHVQSVVVEALDQLAGSLPAGITLEQQLDAGDAAVLGDPTQVHQVVMNLCANAVQAMRSRGTLTVMLDRVDLRSPRCATSVLPDGVYVRLCVRDTGTGIAPQVIERIFDPFFTTKEIGVGTGLGLSLVHGIVTDLGGGIDVQSKLGEGASFTVYLPWNTTVQAPETVQEIVVNGDGETVLLVDDEEALVRLGEEMIAGLGYEPVGFTSSTAALEAFRATPTRFDAVLSDESMPDMTGSELARAIREIRDDIPIVLMSGYVTTALTHRARDAGVLDVLAKPLVARDIARSLADALRQQA
jgi:PAS domain S-box-containing protein